MSVDQRSDRDWLMGGGGAPDAFKRIHRDTPLPVGTSVTGIIESWKREQMRAFKTGDLLWWDKAETEPKEQLVITIQTELCEDRYYNAETREPDKGLRRLFIAKQSQKKALKDAIIAAELDFIERGARITMTLTGYTEPVDDGYPSPDFSAVLVPKAQLELMGEQAQQASYLTAAEQVAAAQHEQARQMLTQGLGAAPAQQAPLSAPAQPAQPAPVSSPAPAAPVAQAATQAPAQAAPAAGVDPAMLAAALAALTPEQRAAMGIG